VKTDAAAGNALQQLTQASRTVADLEEVSDALLGHFVDRCRRQGHSWSEISAALGVSKQAAHKRFSPGANDAPSFERFSPRARAVLAGAAEAARGLGQAQVGPEHLLLALFEPRQSVAAQALLASGVTRAEVEARVLSLGEPARSATGGTEAPVPFTPAAVEVLRGAVVEALQLGHNYIGTEHLLLALYRDEESIAARALVALGVDREQIAAHIMEIFRREL
jgi:hypothetical protein